MKKKKEKMHVSCMYATTKSIKYKVKAPYNRIKKSVASKSWRRAVVLMSVRLLAKTSIDENYSLSFFLIHLNVRNIKELKNSTKRPRGNKKKKKKAQLAQELSSFFVEIFF